MKISTLFSPIHVYVTYTCTHMPFQNKTQNLIFGLYAASEFSAQANLEFCFKPFKHNYV